MNDRYNQPEKGTQNWHQPLNENFADLGVEVATEVQTWEDLPAPGDVERSSAGEWPVYRIAEDDVLAQVTDDGRNVVGGVGSAEHPLPPTHQEAVRADTQSFTDADLVVTPATHDFDDVVAELNAGKRVVAMPGEYEATPEQKDVTDGSLTFVDGARVVVPDDPPAGWLDVHGSTGSSTAITADLSPGDVRISVADTSPFSSGEPALLDDDGGYVTMDGRGEIVYVSEVLDGTTLVVRDEIGLSHSTGDAVELQSMDPLTERNSWQGVTFDCRGVVQSNWPLVTRHHVDGHEFRDITFVNGDGSSMHQYMEDRESYRPKVVDSRNGRVDDGNYGLFWSAERQTRHAEMRNCTVYHGNVAEFGNNGTGPSQDARFVNVTAVGGSFSSNQTVIRPEYVNCRVSNAHDDDNDDKVAFLSDGVEARYVNCTVDGSHTGFNLRGYDESVIDCTVRNASSAGVRFGADGDYPDANTGTKRIRGLTVEGCTAAIASVESPGRLYASDVVAVDNDDLVNLGGTPDLVVIDGGTLRGPNEVTTGTISRIELRNLDVDCQGAVVGDWFRETSANVPDHVLVDGCTFYGIDSGSAIRVADFGTLEVNNCRAPAGEAAVDHYLVRDEGGGSQVVLRGNDARNAERGNGYELRSGEAVTDEANLANDGTAF